MSRPSSRAKVLRRARATLRRLGRIGPADWPAVLITLSVAVVVEIGLRTVRLPTLARVLRVPLAEDPQGHCPDPNGPDLPCAAMRRLEISARVMRHWPFDEKCLRRSLVCGCRIQSLNPQLVVGVSLVDGEVKAHAWLTIAGVSLDPWGSAAFSELVSLGGQ